MCFGSFLIYKYKFFFIKESNKLLRDTPIIVRLFALICYYV